MGKNIEYEKRVMIDENQYHYIKNDYLGHASSIHLSLTNHYFDDDVLSLRKNHMMLRIRLINNEDCELTLKIKQDKGDLEINEEISIGDVDSLIKEFKSNNEEINKYLSSIPHQKIHYLTTLKTDRIEVKEIDHLLVIDQNEYSSTIDYDIEIEASSRELAEKIILNYCDKYSLTYKKDYQSKSRRALSTLKNYSDLL